MFLRGKRIAFTVAATGLAVVLVVGILCRRAVLDHIEAWHFQLTGESVTIEPGQSSDNQDPMSLPFALLASLSGCPVLFEEPGMMMGWSQWLKAE
jgi:hypothetical protein